MADKKSPPGSELTATERLEQMAAEIADLHQRVVAAEDHKADALARVAGLEHRLKVSDDEMAANDEAVAEVEDLREAAADAEAANAAAQLQVSKLQEQLGTRRKPKPKQIRCPLCRDTIRLDQFSQHSRAEHFKNAEVSRKQVGSLRVRRERIAKKIHQDALIIAAQQKAAGVAAMQKRIDASKLDTQSAALEEAQAKASAT